MKKFLSLVAVMAVAVMMSSTVWADFTNDAKTAVVSFTSGGEISFSADLYTWNSTYTGAEAESITWSTDGIQLGKKIDQFKCADVYALIQSTITTLGAKVYVYQDNKNNTNPDFVAVSSRAVGTEWKYNGLVKSTDKSVKTELNYRCVDLPTAKRDITTFPTEFAEFGMRYFVDKSDSDWATQKASDYIIIAKDSGIFTGYNEYAFMCQDPVVMFFGAKFTDRIIAGESYGTNSITFSVAAE